MITAIQASKIAGVSDQTIYRWKDRGLLHPVSEFPKLMFDENEVLKVAKSEKPKSGRKPKQIDSGVMIAMYISGHSAFYIAKRCGMSRQGIINRLKEAGIHIRKRGEL